MRGIFSSFLALGLALLLMQPASAQNVTIELTPITYPIVLPDSGGSFDYLLTVTNQGGTPITATVWCMATLPNGSSWGPALGPVTQTLEAGQTQELRRTQAVPPRAPYGYFTLHAYVGIYPDTVWAQAQFEFQHQEINGTEQEWVARYDAGANAPDWPVALAVDGIGNIYVTGFSSNIGSDVDYATVKYDSNGNQTWEAHYSGVGEYDDYATALAVDGSGNVYVTGRSYASETLTDFATVNYNASGSQNWVARYNRSEYSDDLAYFLAVDNAGNVYVTGMTTGNGIYGDYATVKYDSSGNQIWEACYNGPSDSWDEAYSLAVDLGGNVYVTGWSAGFGYESDYATIKYNSSGNQIWAARYNGPGNSADVAYRLAVDDYGNVYVTGFSIGMGTNRDYATLKYDTEGNQVWLARYNGPGNSYDEANSIAVDNSGNVYVTGYSYGMETSYDYATLKYDAYGNQIWVASYNGPGNREDIASSLALDGDGDVYVTGYSYGAGTNRDYATVKYDAFGNQLWVARYNGPGNNSDQATCLAVGGSGNIYISGQSWDSRTYGDYVTIKYSGGDTWTPVEETVFGQPLPQEFRLEKNFPNPFNTTTAISYQLSANSYISLRVYDSAGRLVETLVNGWRAAGTHELTWEAHDLSSGIYFARMEAGEYVGVQKMVLLK